DILPPPALARELVGRVEPMTLYPFSQGELEGHREGFIEALFAPTPLPRDLGEPVADAAARVLAGGYPEPLRRNDAGRREAWYEAYLTTILQRDLREVGDADRLAALPRLLAMAAARSASLLNISELSRSLAIPRSTLDRYLALLEAACLLRRLPAWSGNLGKRLTRAPKLMLEDSGLAAHLLGLGSNGLDPDRFGPLLEAFVARELVRQASWSSARVGIHHFRTTAGLEVDLLLEDPRGRLVAIEVKASQTLRDRDLKPLRSLGDTLGSKLLRGVLLHLGAQRVDFGPNLHAMPLAALWRLGRAAHDQPAA
ncbi:DUF4143 domain-containing protein, partial [bacterium]|nr:DUF4143 domain-containing protein [bacterium]